MPTDRSAPCRARAGSRVLLAHPVGDLYGSDRVLVESVRAFAEAGWRATVTVGVDGPLRSLVEEAGADYVVTPFPVLRKAFATPSGMASLIREVPGAWRSAAGLIAAERPDLVYVNTVTLPLWAAFARRLSVPVLCHVHEAEHALPAVVRSGLTAPLLAAHRVVANSDTTRDFLGSAMPLVQGRTVVVPNGVAGPPEPPGPPRERVDGRLRLVVVGRISPRKGTREAVEALGRLVAEGVDAELTVVGDVFPGYEWFLAEVREVAASSGVADRVAFTGQVPQVWDALAASDIALVPSHGESFGNAAVEAMLAHRPVVVSDTHGLRDIVRQGENGLLFPPGDAAALAGVIRRAADDWSGTVLRAGRARVEAEERYTVHRYRREIVRVATALADSRSRAR